MEPQSLERLVLLHAQLSPAALLLRARVAAARRRLLETADPVTEVGVAAGFSSQAAYRRAFLAATGLAPDAYRALRTGSDFVLRLPAGYRIADPLTYHGRDEDGVSERVRGRTIVKPLGLPGGRVGVLTIELAPRAARCARSPGGASDVAALDPADLGRARFSRAKATTLVDPRASSATRRSKRWPAARRCTRGTRCSRGAGSVRKPRTTCSCAAAVSRTVFRSVMRACAPPCAACTV